MRAGKGPTTGLLLHRLGRNNEIEERASFLQKGTDVLDTNVRKAIRGSLVVKEQRKCRKSVCTRLLDERRTTSVYKRRVYR